jgi:hypothetical protein
MSDWMRLCGKAVTLCGSQEGFRKESNILKRLVKQFGASDVERMLVGAQLLGWTSLRSLGSKDGLGRRWALTKFWDSEKRQPKRLESLGQTFKRLGLT